MHHHIFISSISELQQDFKKQFLRICQYHQINNEKVYYAYEHIACMLEFLKYFYQKEQIDDRTSKKALVFEMVDAYANLELPTLTKGDMFPHSPIEYLFYVSLCSTMPKQIWQVSYIMPQWEVCNNKYHIDFVLRDRKTGKVKIGIECDGFYMHHSSQYKVEKDNIRDREIKQTEGFDIWHYSGSEIYHGSLKLAQEFWKHVQVTFYPKEQTNSVINYNSFVTELP